MKTLIKNPKIWNHLSKSFYNYNYYQNPKTEEIILVESDEFYGIDSFYSVIGNTKEYIGDCFASDYSWSQEEDIVLFKY